MGTARWQSKARDRPLQGSSPLSADSVLARSPSERDRCPSLSPPAP
ncbi:hypothetical protein [Geitlerinema sp. PCC 7407]|nr:hypothetical protein [Geitlerinema sp. PCC 7407]